MSVIRAVLPADGAVSVFTLIDLLADATKSAADDRDVAQRRADALTDLATEMLTHGRVDLRGLLHPAEVADDGDSDGGNSDDCDNDSESDWYDDELGDSAEAPVVGDENHDVPAAPGSTVSQASTEAERKERRPPAGSSRLLSRQGRRPHLTVTMSLSTLMALDQSPGHLEGYGAISAGLATAIAAGAASLSLAVIDTATGTPLFAGARRKYRPGQQDRDVISVLAGTCRFPSCRQPAWRCDLDHRQPFDHRSPDAGGATDVANLDPYCRRHHLTKHHTDWTPRRHPDGTMTWTSPTGHRYTDHPREMALPGEQPAQIARHAEVGLADPEHREQCGVPVIQDEPTPVAVRIRLAQRRAFREQVRDRIRTAQQTGRLGGASGAGRAPVIASRQTARDHVTAERSAADREWIDGVITQSLSSDSERSYPQPSPTPVEPPTTANHEVDDEPPF